MTAPNKGVLAAAAVRLLAPYLENAIFNIRNADKAVAALVKHQPGIMMWSVVPPVPL
jgi:hypothetical protein